MDKVSESNLEEIFGSAAAVFTGDARSRLKLIRMALKLDQSQLADLLKVGVRTITNIENGGKTSRNPILISSLIAVFGIKGAIYILTGTYAGHFESRKHLVHDEYWKSKHANQGNRTALKERDYYKYREISKQELLMENKKLKEVIKEGSFKASVQKGKT